MTSEIQKTQEELEVLRDINPIYQLSLTYFNLGVELAQKEFLDFLNNLPNSYHGGDTIGNGCQICTKIEELKQSIGGKE